MGRFTGKRLENEVNEINENLAETGALIRFEYAPRNNYHAVDEHEVDANGDRPNTCCRNVGCGTAKEVAEWTWQRYYNILSQMEKERLTKVADALADDNVRLQQELLECQGARKHAIDSQNRR